MIAFPDWKSHAVYQRRPSTGCIPTGYEMLLRAAGAKGITFQTFQDDFDLDQHGGRPRNNFVSVGDAIKRKYPSVEYVRESFPKGKGGDKLARLEALMKQQQPVLVSLAQSLNGGWHIMPVIDWDSNMLTFLHHVGQDGRAYQQSLSKTDFVNRHDNWPGGDDIAYISKC